MIQLSQIYLGVEDAFASTWTAYFQTAWQQTADQRMRPLCGISRSHFVEQLALITQIRNEVDITSSDAQHGGQT